MGDERVTRNGAEIHTRWLQIMKESRARTVYVIGGVAVPRVRNGDEVEVSSADQGVCQDCRAARGQYHAFGQCDIEQCPVCRKQATGCDCVYEGDDDGDDDESA